MNEQERGRDTNSHADVYYVPDHQISTSFNKIISSPSNKVIRQVSLFF